MMAWIGMARPISRMRNETPAARVERRTMRNAAPRQIVSVSTTQTAVRITLLTRYRPSPAPNTVPYSDTVSPPEGSQGLLVR